MNSAIGDETIPVGVRPVGEQAADVDAKTLERWLAQYRRERVTSCSRITVGIGNDTFSATCASGARYVLRRMRSQAVASVNAEARIQQALTRAGISSPVYLTLADGGVIGRDGDAAFTVSEQLAGEHPRQLSKELIASFGETMARIHDALDPQAIDVPYNPGQWLNPRNVAAEIARCPPQRQRGLQALAAAGSPIFELALPKAVIHGELATNNVFAEGGRVTTILDFENAEHAPRLLDLAYTHLSILYDDAIAPEQVLASLLDGYDRATSLPLGELERSALPLALKHAAAAASAWCYSRELNDYGDRFSATAR